MSNSAYTNFSTKIGKSPKGRLLARIEMIAQLIIARGYKQIEKLPDDLTAAFEKDGVARSVGADLEYAISDSIIGPNGHVQIVGRFALEKDGEVYMSFVDLGRL